MNYQAYIHLYITGFKIYKGFYIMDLHRINLLKLTELSSFELLFDSKVL
jgi:hypothetical protein